MMSFQTRLKLAFRNIAKNRRRSLLTISAVAVGFIAMSLLEGYFTYIYRTLEAQAIVGERLGHLTVTKRGFYEKAMQDPRKYAFDKNELAKATEVIASNAQVQLVSPRLSVSGLVSNGVISRIFTGEAVLPEDIAALRGEKYADLPGRLDPADPAAAVFGAKLTEYLDIALGQEATILTSTIDGMVNAIDVKVGEVSNTGSLATDDKSLLLSLALARRVMAFDGADRIVVLLKSDDALGSVKDDLIERLQQSGFDVEIKEWNVLSQYYAQVKGLFDVMYLFIALVFAIVVMFSVANTLGMSIAERTREIGTLRAVGIRRRTLNSLFVIEGVSMVMVGSLLGVAATYGLSEAINAAAITYTPPDSTVEAELVIELLGSNLFGSVFTLAVLAILASYFPARKGSRKPIVEALAHV